MSASSSPLRVDLNEIKKTSTIGEMTNGKGDVAQSGVEGLGVQWRPHVSKEEVQQSHEEENIDAEIASQLASLIDQVGETIHNENTIAEVIASYVAQWINCPSCDTRTITEDELDTHLAETHNWHGYGCLVKGCVIKYSLRSQLIEHLRLDHSSDVQVGCAICDESFCRAQFFMHLIDYHNVEILEPLVKEKENHS